MNIQRKPQGVTPCPGCGQAFTPVRRRQTACRPSCEARAQWRKSLQRPPNLFNGFELTSEWPDERDDGGTAKR